MKVPPSRHPQTAEVIEQKSEENMMDLLMKVNERLTDTEQALEKALKEKQGESISQPPEVIPTVTSAFASTTTKTSSPNVPTVTAAVIIGTETTTATLDNITSMST